MFVSIPGCWFRISSRDHIKENSIFSYCLREVTENFRHFLNHYLFFLLFFFLHSYISVLLSIALNLFLVLSNFFNSCQLLLNYILLSTQNILLHLLFCSLTAQKYPVVHLLQKGDNSFNQELLKNMVKSIKMNDVYGPMSQILETLNKCPHFKRQR